MKRPLRKRAKRSGEERHDGDECIAPVSSEEKSFRVFFLSRQTGIDPDIARELVDRIEGDGASLLNAARQTKTTRDD
jgi:hypothetical protein